MKFNILWLLPLLLIPAACKNDIETINALNTEVKIPDIIAYDIESAFHDSGVLQGKVVAKEVNIFNNAEKPYTEFPQGIEVYFYDSAGNTTASIEAGYAINYQHEGLWEARNNVFAENNVENATLETEQLFWDEKNKKIYSTKFSKITNPDGIFYGENGFDANQDLTNWTLRSSRGTANVENEAASE